MEVFDKLPLLRQFDELMKVYHVLASESCETGNSSCNHCFKNEANVFHVEFQAILDYTLCLEFLQFASQFEHFRKRGYQAENFSQQLQEKLTKVVFFQ